MLIIEKTGGGEVHGNFVLAAHFSKYKAALKKNKGY